MSTLLRALASILLPTLLTACDRNAPAPSAEPSTEPPATAQAAPPPLLARELLFGNPRTRQRPDEPRRPLARLHRPARRRAERLCRAERRSDEAKPVTNDRLRGIRGYAFAFTGNHLLYVQDVGGDENFHVFLVDLATGEEKTLTPKGSRAGIAALSPKHPNEVILSVNDRDPMYFDLLRVNLMTGEQTRLFENKEFANVIVDRDFALRYAAQADRRRRSGAVRARRRRLAQLVHDPAGGRADDRRSRHDDGRQDDSTCSTAATATPAALFAIDAATGERHLVHEDARADVGGAIVHPETGSCRPCP